jgi:hypothetical protein
MIPTNISNIDTAAGKNPGPMSVIEPMGKAQDALKKIIPIRKKMQPVIVSLRFLLIFMPISIKTLLLIPQREILKHSLKV